MALCFLYVLHSASADRYYVGVSNAPERRLAFHNTVERGWTARYRPWQLVWTHPFATRSEALRAERTVKRWKSRRMLVRLIAGEITL